MGIISRAADLYYTYKFLKTLVTDWEDMEAYKLGVIDDNGKFLLKGKQLTSDQKDSDDNPYSTDFIGVVQVGDPDSENFTAFADLKESTVIGWIESALDVAAMKSSVDSALADVITPSSVTKVVPW